MTARSPAEEEAWRYIVFRLENDPGFWFGLIAGDDRRPRKRLRDRAEAWCKAHGVAFLEHTRPPAELRMVAVDLSRNPEKGLHWIHADGPEARAAEWDAGAKAMLMAMNERRDAYRRHLLAGVVVDGRLSLKPILRDFAPDMFSIRAFVAEPGADRGDPLPVLVRPKTYFHIPLQEITESTASLLARAERLGKIDDRHAVMLRLRALAAVIGKLQQEGRWGEAQSVAERLAKESLLEVKSEGGWALSLFARAAKVESSIPLDEPPVALARIRAEMDDARSLANGDSSGFKSIPLAILMLAELQILQRMRRWDEVRVTLADLAQLAQASPPDEPYSPLSIVLPVMFGACNSAAIGLRTQGDLDRAAATVDVMLGLTETVRQRSPDDPRWHLERGRALLLRIDDFLVQGDFRSALATSRTVLLLLEEHGEADVDEWSVLHRGAQLGSLVALVSLQDWKSVAEITSTALEEKGTAPPPDDETAWYKACVTIWRAHAARQLSSDISLGPMVDEALQAVSAAVGRSGDPLAAFVIGSAPYLLGAMAAACGSPLEADSSVEQLALLKDRLGRAQRAFAGLFMQFPTTQSQAALLAATGAYLDCAALFDEDGRAWWITWRAERRLRRQTRVLRRWRRGKRLPRFVVQWARRLPQSDADQAA